MLFRSVAVENKAIESLQISRQHYIHQPSAHLLPIHVRFPSYGSPFISPTTLGTLYVTLVDKVQLARRLTIFDLGFAFGFNGLLWAYTYSHRIFSFPANLPRDTSYDTFMKEITHNCLMTVSFLSYFLFSY